MSAKRIQLLQVSHVNRILLHVRVNTCKKTCNSMYRNSHVLAVRPTKVLCDMTMQLSLPDAGAYTGIDWRRTRLFATFGALFVGAWQYALFSVAVPRALPYMATWAQRPLREKLRDPRGLLQLGCLVAVENCFNLRWYLLFFHQPKL